MIASISMIIVQIARRFLSSSLFCITFQRTFDGKNSAFLKSFKITDVINVPRNNITDIRKTFGSYSGKLQSAPTNVPPNFCIFKEKIQFETIHFIRRYSIKLLRCNASCHMLPMAVIPYCCQVIHTCNHKTLEG